jgi:hypothetical protein
MPSPVPSSPPPPEAPNRRLHYVGLGLLVIAVIVGLIAIV